MLELTIGQANEKILVTLDELKTLDNPFYLFVFEHVTTKKIVAVVMGADESQFPYRFNQFEINTAAVFDEQPPGEWHYTAYEQESDTNIDPVLSGAVVEYGEMLLYKEDEFTYSKYNESVTYKAYNG